VYIVLLVVILVFIFISKGVFFEIKIQNYIDNNRMYL